MSPESPSPTTDPTTSAARPIRLFSLGEVLPIVVTAAVAGIAVGYLLAQWNDQTVEILARIVASVALVTVIVMIFEARRRRHIDRVVERLDRIEARLAAQYDAELVGYNRGYTDCLKDRSHKA